MGDDKRGGERKKGSGKIMQLKKSNKNIFSWLKLCVNCSVIINNFPRSLVHFKISFVVENS